jgi:trigger factor
MQVHIEDLSPVEKKLAVEVPWPVVAERLEAAYRELGRDVKLKGFRPGKVPRDVLVRMFGKQVQMDVAKSLVQETFLTAARQHKLEVVAEPVVEDAVIKRGENFKYSARVEVRGEVKIDKVDGLQGTRKKVVVEDSEVEHALEHERQRHTELKPIEGRTTAAATDIIVVAVKGAVGEFKVDRPELLVDLSDANHDPLPGLTKALLGIPLDAKDHEVTLEMPADHAQKELAGKTAQLKVTVKDAREKLVPALDDEFAKDTGEAQTLAELRELLKKRLLEGKQKDAERDMRQSVLKAFVAANPVPVAPALVERAVDAQLERARYQFAVQGIDLDRSGVDVRGLREKLREPGLEEVRGQLLLEALAEREKLVVADAEVDAKVAELAERRGKAPGKLKAEMDRDGSLESLRWQLRQDKALDHVVSRATIVEAEPDPKK